MELYVLKRGGQQIKLLFGQANMRFGRDNRRRKLDKLGEKKSNYEYRIKHNEDEGPCSQVYM